MRHIVIGSSHYTALVLSALRETDPAGLVIVIDRSREAAETLASSIGGALSWETQQTKGSRRLRGWIRLTYS